jgi:dienelactone hydrolase
VFIPLIVAAQKLQELDISGAHAWTDTGIDLKAGDTVHISATGSVHFDGAKENGPDGLARGWLDLVRILPLNDAGRGALLGKIGSSDAARPFLIGPRAQIKAPIDGRLFLGLNESSNDQPEGGFHVTIERTARPASAAAASNAPLPKLTQEMLDKIPTRISDSLGNAGDRVNFLIVGSEARVHRVLDSAGWIQPDKSIKNAFLRGALETFSKEAYVTMPISDLMLFDRKQDFGYAQADPIKVIAARHHFRLWRAPFDVEGQPLWAGAGTHDIGLEKDQRNGKLTHKIDPAVDGERDYIGQSLQQTGLVAKLDYMTPSNPVTEARTATGGGFHSDGRTLVVYLQPDTQDFSQKFADLFCSVLRQHHPDTGDWGACSNYLEAPGKENLALPPLPTKYRLLIVPGILSSCASNAPAFDEGQKYLREKYGMSVDLLGVPNNSCEENAHMIAAYLRDHQKSDPRKFIVLGYSKGAPDVQVTLAEQDGAAAAVAAFITVAGASGGSPIADTLPEQINGWVTKFQNMGKCEGDLSTGFKSLKREVRQAFLASYPDPVVPTYSIVAVAGKDNTSSALLTAQQLLSVFDATNDAQLTKWDAIVPGAKFLGAARADHLAVALPFDMISDGELQKMMNHSRFPRAALLEALVRFVVEDLESAK